MTSSERPLRAAIKVTEQQSADNLVNHDRLKPCIVTQVQQHQQHHHNHNHDHNHHPQTVIRSSNQSSPLIVSRGHVDLISGKMLYTADKTISWDSPSSSSRPTDSPNVLKVIESLDSLKLTSDQQRKPPLLACDHKGNTPLHEAAWNGYSQTIEKLLKSNSCCVNAKNKAKFTPLHLACQQGHNQSGRLLLWAGGKADARNRYGDTALHTACRYGHAGVARILISAHCDVSPVNKNGDTPLHITAAMGRSKLTKILLESGCDPVIKNQQGETAMDIALRKAFFKVQEIIANPPPMRPRAELPRLVVHHRRHPRRADISVSALPKKRHKLGSLGTDHSR
ncbi:Ankyrin repeat domain-containing protein 6 [Halotydeus destructor]|nr:Ankyrin repeat domain-containing protein 6 [Halotydeus destructor]